MDPFDYIVVDLTTSWQPSTEEDEAPITRYSETMGVVESLPSSTGIHEYHHNRRYIFGNRRRDAYASSSDSSGSLLAPQKSLKSATVCLSDGIMFDTNEEQPSSSSSVLSLRSRSRTRSRLRDSLKRHSLWQLSPAWALLPRQDPIPNSKGDLGACEQPPDSDEEPSGNLAAMSPPLQRPLLSASMPNLPIHQLQQDNEYCGTGEPLQYAHDSDSLSEENNAYSLGSSSNGSETMGASQQPLTKQSNDLGDAPVDRPKSRRRLDPRVIGKYLSHRLSYCPSMPSSNASQSKVTAEEEDAVTKGCVNDGRPKSFPAMHLPGYGDGLVQLNTDFEKLGVCYDDLVDRSKVGSSETANSTPWLLLLDEPLLAADERFSSIMGNKKDQPMGGGAENLALSESGNPVLLPDEISSMSSSLTLSEIDLDSLPSSSSSSSSSSLAKDTDNQVYVDAQDVNCADDVLDYDEYIYLSASCGEDKENSSVAPPVRRAGYLPVDLSAQDKEEEEEEEEEVRRWWPRRVLPVRNMQYMPNLSKVFSDCRLQSLYSDTTDEDDENSFLCAHCAYSNSDKGYVGAVSRGHRFSENQPVDEAMMMMDSSDPSPSPQSPLLSSSLSMYCSDSRCRYYHTRTSSVMRWLATGYPVKPLCRKDSDGTQQSSGYRLDYWDILSRFPMRPTSSLALSSLREMAVSLCSDNGKGNKPTQQQRQSRRSCVELPGNRSSYIAAIGDSDDESSSDTEETTSSCRLGNGSLNLHAAGQQQRSKQKQKRVLSEPMQYILYNSYLRYYGKPSEQTS
ncbi:hypothetical protein LPJ74_004019 [Coemansia sp. RSA 1843]|nr:hypothetical protein LPJ74_004019 [Coemansia sp. RSA 1843]